VDNFPTKESIFFQVLKKTKILANKNLYFYWIFRYYQGGLMKTPLVVSKVKLLLLHPAPLPHSHRPYVPLSF
jgi:hypothetical protein